MNRRNFLTTLGAAGLASAQAPRRPNLVFILSDDHRYDFVGALGHPWLKGKTPNMDRMIQQGVHFKNAFVTTSLCSPSRASILTSQYIFRHGVLNNSTSLPTQHPTFPKILRENGYRTGFIGKWHMGQDDDPKPGFDHWFSFLGQGDYFNPKINRNGKRVQMDGYMADILTDEAETFLRQKSSQPFCLYLSHKNVHHDFSPAPRHKGVFRDYEIPYPETYVNRPHNRAGKPDWLLKQRNSWHGADGAMAKSGGFERLYRGYCEGLLSVDESIGRVRAELARQGVLENTIIVYMGDNGYLHGEHGLIDKRVMHEPSMRVPLFLEAPGWIKQPRAINQLVTNLDIAPSFLGLAGISSPKEFQGLNFTPLLTNSPAEWRKEFTYIYFWEREAPQTPTILGLRTEKYSYMQYHGVWDTWELYDIEKDPDQKNNLLAGTVTGMDYGRFDRFIPNPEVRELHADLQKRLFAEVQRLGGRIDPHWAL
jgi:N-acetylglucosamine-6-sulfatase